MNDSWNIPDEVPRSLSPLHVGPHSIDIDPEYNQSVCTCSYCGTPYSTVLEFKRLHQNNEFILQGMKNDHKTISLTLRIADKDDGKCVGIEFEFVHPTCGNWLREITCLNCRSGEEHTL